MSILIKGLEMPVFEHQSLDIRKGADGKWYMVDTNAETSDGAWHEIVPILPHGRLGDLDELKTAFPCGESIRTESVRATIDHMPTVIPAEEGET